MSYSLKLYTIRMQNGVVHSTQAHMGAYVQLSYMTEDLKKESEEEQVSLNVSLKSNFFLDLNGRYGRQVAPKHYALSYLKINTYMHTHAHSHTYAYTSHTVHTHATIHWRLSLSVSTQ